MPLQSVRMALQSVGVQSVDCQCVWIPTVLCGVVWRRADGWGRLRPNPHLRNQVEAAHINTRVQV